MMHHSRNKDPDKSNTPLLHDQLNSPDCETEQWEQRDTSASSKKKTYNSTSSPSKGVLSSSKWNGDDWGESEDWGPEQKAVTNSPLKLSSSSQGKTSSQPQLPHSRPKSSSSKSKKDKEGEQLLIDFGEDQEVTKQTWSGWTEWGPEESNPKKGYQRIGSKNY